MAETGLNFTQLTILSLIAKYAGTGVAELAQRLQVSESSMSMKIDQLVQTGYAERDRSTTDRRRVTVQLTNKGKQGLENAYGKNSKLIAPITQAFQLPNHSLDEVFEINQQILNKLLEVCKSNECKTPISH